jgi:hypothetical protein
MGVSGQDRVVPVGRELVEHPDVRRMRDPQSHVGSGVGGSGHG